MRRGPEREGEDVERSEAELVRGLLARDEGAFERFADDYLPALYRFALRRLRDHDLTEEIVQTTACRAIARLESFRGEAGLATWLCAICRNEIAGHYRRLGRWREVGLDEETAEATAPNREPAPGPEAELLGRERGELVHEALDALPPRYGRALEWKYLERLPVREIAVRLGVGPKAAESLLTRAREAFRSLYRELSSVPGRLDAEGGGS